jgi:hypothetical protein
MADSSEILAKIASILKSEYHVAMSSDTKKEQEVITQLVSVILALEIAEIREKSRGHWYVMADNNGRIPKFFLRLTVDGIGITYGVLTPKGENNDDT